MIHQSMKVATANADQYAKSKGLTIEGSFGYGKEGFVLQTNQKTAIKAFYHLSDYRYELDVYDYLKLWKITEVAGFNIPELVDSSESLRAIEISVVVPPYILDFAQTQIDTPIERDEDWLANTQDLFEDDWNQVKIAIWRLEEHGIYLADVHPGNVRCH